MIGVKNTHCKAYGFHLIFLLKSEFFQSGNQRINSVSTQFIFPQTIFLEVRTYYERLCMLWKVFQIFRRHSGSKDNRKARSGSPGTRDIG